MTPFLLFLIITTASCFNIESHLEIWCEEPIKTVDLYSINLKTNADFYKKILIHRCGIWLRHIPNKNWSSELTELFREPFKTKLNVLKISDGLKALNQNFFTIESKLKYLDLSGNDLDYLMFPELKFAPPVVHQNIFDHLYTLDLSKNKFTNISFVRTKIPNLKELDLSQNKLTEVPLSTLLHFVDLEKLILRQNNITKFQTSVEFSSIEYLDLSNNHLRDLLGAEKLANLHTLIVSHNDLQIIHSNSFKDGIWGLKDLYLDHNNIMEVSEDAFKYFPNLKTLKLDNNLIHDLKQSTFSVLKRLESLDVSHNFIASLDADLFTNQNSLVELNLKNNSLKTLNYAYMVHHTPSLNEIDVLENSFQCEYFEKMLLYFMEKNIIVPSGEICLDDSKDITTCCIMESTTVSNSHLAESEAMKIITEKVDPVHWTFSKSSYNISQFFSSMERKSDTLLKLFVYQFAFIISVSFLVFVIYISRNFEHKTTKLDRKQPELEKIISS